MFGHFRVACSVNVVEITSVVRRKNSVSRKHSVLDIVARRTDVHVCRMFVRLKLVESCINIINRSKFNSVLEHRVSSGIFI